MGKRLPMVGMKTSKITALRTKHDKYIQGLKVLSLSTNPIKSVKVILVHKEVLGSHSCRPIRT